MTKHAKRDTKLALHNATVLKHNTIGLVTTLLEQSQFKEAAYTVGVVEGIDEAISMFKESL